MVDVRGDVLRPPHGTTPAAVKANIKSEMRSFKSNENIPKKEGGSYYVVSANKVFMTPYGLFTRKFDPTSSHSSLSHGTSLHYHKHYRYKKIMQNNS